mgnify:CR=1 FL=1
MMVSIIFITHLLIQLAGYDVMCVLCSRDLLNATRTYSLFEEIQLVF